MGTSPQCGVCVLQDLLVSGCWLPSVSTTADVRAATSVLLIAEMSQVLFNTRELTASISPMGSRLGDSGVDRCRLGGLSE